LNNKKHYTKILIYTFLPAIPESTLLALLCFELTVVLHLYQSSMNTPHTCVTPHVTSVC